MAALDFLNNFGTFSKENSILNRFLFPAPKPSYNWNSFPGELICVVGREGNVVPCNLMPGMSATSDESRQTDSEEPASILLIYCHANGEDIGVLYEAGHWLCDTLGVHVLIPEYPGYGVSPGSPNELSVNRNVETAYDFAVNALHWDPQHIVLFGRSIGTGPAVKIASEMECGGLILVSPYTSVKDMVRTHAGVVTSWLTAEFANMFPNDEMIGGVGCPTLIVHGAQDLVIPSDHALRLHSSSHAEQKRLIILEGIGHHGIDLHFAVAHESPQLFKLSDYPKVLNLDQFLCDPSLQGDTVVSPVPAFDCRTMSWSRPALHHVTAPYLKGPSALSTMPAQGIPLDDHLEADERRIVTDDVLLARISRQRVEDQLQEKQYFKTLNEQHHRKTHGGSRAEAINSTNGVRPIPNGQASPASPIRSPSQLTGLVENGGILYRTDGQGRVVEVPWGLPPDGPDNSHKPAPSSRGEDGGSGRLFVY